MNTEWTWVRVPPPPQNKNMNILETLLILLCLPISFLFHLIVYENHWEQKPLTRIVLGISLVALPFLLIIS